MSDSANSESSDAEDLFEKYLQNRQTQKQNVKDLITQMDHEVNEEILKTQKLNFDDFNDETNEQTNANSNQNSIINEIEQESEKSISDQQLSEHLVETPLQIDISEPQLVNNQTSTLTEMALQAQQKAQRYLKQYIEKIDSQKQQAKQQKLMKLKIKQKKTKNVLKNVEFQIINQTNINDKLNQLSQKMKETQSLLAKNQQQFELRKQKFTQIQSNFTHIEQFIENQQLKYQFFDTQFIPKLLLTITEKDKNNSKQLIESSQLSVLSLKIENIIIDQSQFNNLPNLISLNVQNTNLTTLSLILPNIVEINFSNNKLTNFTVDAPFLNSLKLTNNNLSQLLITAPIINILYLNQNQTLSQIQNLSYFPFLKDVNLSETSLLFEFNNVILSFLESIILSKFELKFQNCFLPNLKRFEGEIVNFPEDFQDKFFDFNHVFPLVETVNFRNVISPISKEFIGALKVVFPKISNFQQNEVQVQTTKIQQLEYNNQYVFDFINRQQKRKELPVYPGRFFNYQIKTADLEEIKEILADLNVKILQFSTEKNSNNLFEYYTLIYNIQMKPQKSKVEFEFDRKNITELARIRALYQRRNYFCQNNIVQSRKFGRNFEFLAALKIQKFYRKIISQKVLKFVISKLLYNNIQFKKILQSKLQKIEQIKLTDKKQKDLQIALQEKQRLIEAENAARNFKISKFEVILKRKIAKVAYETMSQSVETNFTVRIQRFAKIFIFKNKLNQILSQARERIVLKQTNLLQTKKNIQDMFNDDFDDFEEAIPSFQNEISSQEDFDEELNTMNLSGYLKEVQNQQQPIKIQIQKKTTPLAQIKDDNVDILNQAVTPRKISAIEKAKKEGWNFETEEAAIAWLKRQKKGLSQNVVHMTAKQKYENMLNKRRQ